jgi:D-glycero-D-manno-heptose 1,7-bisphosphate phosphatase
LRDSGLRAAVFLDRDGTLNEEVGYVNHPSRFQVYPWAAEAVGELNRAGLAAVVVTNQSGVARGYFEEALVARLHQQLRREIEQAGAHLDGIYYCPHHPEGRVAEFRRECDCRKPMLGLIERAAADLKLDLARSYVVGDRFLDMEMARRGGMRGIFVLTGYGLGEYENHRTKWPHQPWRVEKDVLAAVRVILAEPRS